MPGNLLLRFSSTKSKIASKILCRSPELKLNRYMNLFQVLFKGKILPWPCADLISV